MNKQQQTFVTEMLRHGDKLKAYRTAYPKAKTGKAIESSVNRLLKQPEIKAAIEEPYTRLKAEAEAELRQRLQAELVDLCETQKILSSIIRGQHTVEKEVHTRHGLQPITVKPTIGQVLTALNTWYRLNGYITTTKSQQKTTNNTSPLREGSGVCPPAQEDITLPTEPEKVQPHPFGNIYPPGYPGPYYDPGDPNTKQKLRELGINLPTPANHSSPPSEGGGPAGQPGETQHLSPAVLRENTTTNTSPLREGSGVCPLANDKPTQDKPTPQAHTTNPRPSTGGEAKQNSPIQSQQNTTTQTSPPSEGGVSCKDGVVATQHRHTTTGNKNKPSPHLEGGRPAGQPGETQHRSPAVLRENTTTNTSPLREGSGVCPPAQDKPSPHTHTANTPPSTGGEAKQQHTQTTPLSEGGVSCKDGVVATQHRHTTTAGNNNKPSPPGGAGGGFSPRVQRFILIDKLRKQGWLTIEDAFNLVSETYLRNQHRGTLQMMKLFEKARLNRNAPPELRAPIEKETGWTFHPEYPFMMKRTRPLGW